jgi:uncharacterized protein YbjT (DUF2867 family)
VIAALLTQPSEHIGKTYPLFGPVELSQREIAEDLSKLLKRKVEYSPTTLEGYRKHLEKYNLPEFIIQHFIEVAVDYQNGIFAGTNDVIERITGQAPQTIEEFVEAHRAAFAE